MIRRANIGDMERITAVHIACFPDSFSTAIGKFRGGGYLLKEYYKEYFDRFPELFIVDEENDDIIGFCMGYPCEETSVKKSFMKHNLFALLICMGSLLLTGNKTAWGKVKSIFFKNRVYKIKSVSRDVLTGDLLSICVLEEYRGQGIAARLLNEFQQSLIRHGCKQCILSVLVNNEAGIRFYKKNGFEPYKIYEGKAIFFFKPVK